MQAEVCAVAGAIGQDHGRGRPRRVLTCLSSASFYSIDMTDFHRWGLG